MQWQMLYEHKDEEISASLNTENKTQNENRQTNKQKLRYCLLLPKVQNTEVKIQMSN